MPESSTFDKWKEFLFGAGTLNKLAGADKAPQASAAQGISPEETRWGAEYMRQQVEAGEKARKEQEAREMHQGKAMPAPAGKKPTDLLMKGSKKKKGGAVKVAPSGY